MSSFIKIGKSNPSTYKSKQQLPLKQSLGESEGNSGLLQCFLSTFGLVLLYMYCDIQ